MSLPNSYLICFPSPGHYPGAMSDSSCKALLLQRYSDFPDHSLVIIHKSANRLGHWRAGETPYAPGPTPIKPPPGRCTRPATGFSGKLPAQQHRAPCKPAAHGFHQYQIAVVQALILKCLIEGKRNGCR